MRRGVRVLAVVMAAVCAMAVRVPVAAADAAGWPLTVPAPTLLGFGATYTAPDGTSAVHRGVDLSASEGSTILAVLEGTVTFAGRIPAGDGVTALAVTVESGDVRLTYSPLAGLSVGAGDAVAPGGPLGVLAANGDRSHPDPHLHLSARRGSLYIDPAAFLLPPAPAPTPAPEPAAHPVPVRVPQPAAPAVASAASPAPQSVTAPVPAGAPRPAGVTAARALPVGAPSGQASVAAPLPGGSPRAVVSQPAAPVVAAGSVRIPVAASVLPALRPLPAPAAAALATDRRAAIAGSTAVPVGGLAGLAALLAGLLLWPLWRAMPVLSVPVIPERQDVAAVVAR